MQKTYRLLILLALLVTAFVSTMSKGLFWGDPGKPEPIPPSIQRSGNAVTGYQYLTTGDYVKGGIPYEFFLLGKGRETRNFLNRTGLNTNISHDFTVITSANGENLVAPNCLQCHAQVFNDSLVIGLGNSFMDFSMGDQLNPTNMRMMGNLLKISSQAKYEAAKHFLQVSGTVGPYLKTAVRGVNSADRLAAVLAAHRDPVSFQWSDSASIEIPEEVIPSDVPAWWLLKKKNAMFYSGFGRGDFGRFLMAANLLTVKDTSEAAGVDRKINDLLAYLYTLKPPKFPGKINKPLAEKGRLIFNDHCSKCHGHYGEKEDYPNLMIPSHIIKTDSALFSSNYQNPQFIEWFNRSWFASGDHPAKLVPFRGYIAPPLDGVWCTSPYLHNGSIPSIEAVLNSKKRPTYWWRDFDQPTYDYKSLGWKFEAKDSAGDATIYNTTLKGYGNYGHYFGDKLTDEERAAVIEYLKTL